jgi:hypothetical protein
MSDLTLTRDTQTTMDDLQALGIDAVRTNGFRFRITDGAVVDCSGNVPAGSVRVFEEGKAPVVLQHAVFDSGEARGPGGSGGGVILVFGNVAGTFSTRGGTGGRGSVDNDSRHGL